ncbi:MAG: SGNH/GDSL hydrolase family protein, partial [Gemmatimonadota bacterium]
RGRPQFSFLRYVDNVRPGEDEETAREGDGGGIVHAVVQLDVDDRAVRAAENELGRERPGARIVGPVIYRSGTFGLVSSFMEEDGELTRRVVGLGAAPVLEGSRAAISIRLTKLGSKILWESFEMTQPDVSFVFEMEVAGLRAPVRARLEADWDRIYKHQSFQAAVAAPVLAGEVSAAFDDLRDTGAIRLVQVGEDAQQAKMVQAAYDKLMTLMLEPVEGTGMPSLGQLAGQAGGGGLLDRATKMLASARAEADKRVQQVVDAVPGVRPAAAAREAAAEKPSRATKAVAAAADADAADEPDRPAPADTEPTGAGDDVAALAVSEDRSQDEPDTELSRDRKRAYMKLIWEREADYLDTKVLPDYEAWAKSVAQDEAKERSACTPDLDRDDLNGCLGLAEISAGMEQRLLTDLIPRLRHRIDTKRALADTGVDPSLLAEIREDPRIDRLAKLWANLASYRGHMVVQEEAIEGLQPLLDSPDVSDHAKKVIREDTSGWEKVLAKNRKNHKETGRETAELQREIGLTAEHPDLMDDPTVDPGLLEDLGFGAEPPPKMDDILDRIEGGGAADAPNSPAATGAELRLVDDSGEAGSIGDGLWIASLGDSFSSGEGNPTTTGVPINAWKWMDDEKCHRSKWGWPHVVADIVTEHIKRPVNFTFLACSGGELNEGLLKSFTDRGVDREPQLDKLEALIKASGRVPDVVLMTGGGNDMGFADVVIECISPGNCPGGEATDSLKARVGRLQGEDGRYAKVAKRLEGMGVAPDRVVLLMYPDPLFGRKRSGSAWGPNEVQVGCFIPAGPRMWTWASENVVVPLQELQRERAAALGWRLADNHVFEFQKHSYCPRISFRGGDSWWVGILAQIVKQWGLGAFHPNRRGHRELARSAILEMSKFLPDMPQLTARTEEPVVGGAGGAVAGGAGGAVAGGAAGGGGGAGGAAAASSRPNIAVVAALQLRKRRQRGTFELDMSKYMAGSQVINFAQPIGDLRRYKDDDRVFRQINLDQPLFRQREVAFRLDGLNAADFGEYVNFVNVQLRRGDAVREELTVGAERFNERGHDFRLLYGFSGEESRDEWMEYEYRTVWSLFGGLSVEEPWQTGRDGTVALPAPYVRRTIDLEGSPKALVGVGAVTVHLYYAAGEEERFSEAVLRPGRGETVSSADVLLPVGETEYEYEITWLYGNNSSESTGRQRTANPILFLNPPQD